MTALPSPPARALVSLAFGPTLSRRCVAGLCMPKQSPKVVSRILLCFQRLLIPCFLFIPFISRLRFPLSSLRIPFFSTPFFTFLYRVFSQVFPPLLFCSNPSFLLLSCRFYFSPFFDVLMVNKSINSPEDIQHPAYPTLSMRKATRTRKEKNNDKA